MVSPLSALQQVVVDWGIRPIDILVTLLLMLIGTLSGWTLRTVLQHQDDVTKLKAKVGLEGGNGHAKKLEEHARALEQLEKNWDDAWKRIDRMIVRVIRRLDRLEHHAKMPRLRDDDDAEGD